MRDPPLDPNDAEIRSRANSRPLLPTRSKESATNCRYILTEISSFSGKLPPENRQKQEVIRWGKDLPLHTKQARKKMRNPGIISKPRVCAKHGEKNKLASVV